MLFIVFHVVFTLTNTDKIIFIFSEAYSLALSGQVPEKIMFLNISYPCPYGPQISLLFHPKLACSISSVLFAGLLSSAIK